MRFFENQNESFKFQLIATGLDPRYSFLMDLIGERSLSTLQ